MRNRRHQRRAPRRQHRMLIGAWVPCDWVQTIDAVVARQNLDRGKIIRRALEKKLAEGAP